VKPGGQALPAIVHCRAMGASLQRRVAGWRYCTCASEATNLHGLSAGAGAEVASVLVGLDHRDGEWDGEGIDALDLASREIDFLGLLPLDSQPVIHA